MTVDLAAGIALIVVPVAFNLAFAALARSFDYPDILRREPAEILERFAAGGPGLILRWEALLASALGMLVVVPLVSAVVSAGPALTWLSIVVGTAAALVQALGLVRWPYAVPELARRHRAAQGPQGVVARESIETTFATLHRLLGVGVGEHLGYLLTGLWTLLLSASILSTAAVPGWLGMLGLPIGIAVLVGTLEFAGANERDGWAAIGQIVPIAYLAWSAWLIVLGVVILLP